MEYQLGDHAFFWVNPHLDALSPAAANAAWMNWGGDKVWLAPQGWGGEDEWAGPPDPVLDGGRFDAEADTDGTSITVSLTSQHDQRSGMQLSRTLRFRAGTTRVDIVCTMTNRSDRSRRWGLWPVAQIDAASRRNEDMNTQLRACVPLRRDSAYDAGYRVIYGDVENPQYSVSGGMLDVTYQHRVGKIGADSNAGWTAVIDGETGAVLVMQMTFDPHAEYPDGASVEIWTNGLGTLTAYGRTEAMPESLVSNPYMLECELLSPFAQLAPGQSYDFAYTWAATNIGADDEKRRSLRSCNAFCCEVETFAVAAGGELSGRFGVFYDAHCFIEFVDAHDCVLGAVRVDRVSPLTPLVLQGAVIAPPSAVSAVLALYAGETPADSERVGELARATLQASTSNC